MSPTVEALETRIAELEKEIQTSKLQSKMYLQNVAHQLTAPLGAIKWSIEAIKDEQVPINRKMNLLRSIYSQSGLLVHLVKNFALMSNLEADEHLGQLKNQEEIDLMLMAINLANDFQPQAFELEKKIFVEDDVFRRALQGKKLIAERNLVAQSLSNLLENAVKYADPKTTIKLTAATLSTGIGVTVKSSGLPINPDEKEKILHRSFRGQAARQRVATGTGIGLYLADRVMRLHNGTIEITATGRESIFTLAFPKERFK